MVTVKILIIALLAVGGIYAYANYDTATFNGIINNIPGISTSENKLQDCSIYKKQYSKDFSDNSDNMITGALDGVAKTRACEKYNAEITKAGQTDPGKQQRIQAELERVALARVEQEAYNKAAEELAQRIKNYNEAFPLVREPSLMAEQRLQIYGFNGRHCVDITKKDLSGCDMRGVTMHDRDFSYTNFTGADMYQVDLARANFTGANLDGAYFANTVITDTIFTGCIGIPQGIPLGEPLGEPSPICTPLPPK
jgi:uncharacterized protein YjbI with pentapeptide repeats